MSQNERVVQAILEDNGGMSDSSMYLCLLGFLTSSWQGRKHIGLVFSDGHELTLNETKREILRFIDSIKKDEQS